MPTKPCPQCRRPVNSDAHYCAFCGHAFTAGLTGRLSPDALLDSRYLIVRLMGQGGMGAVYQAVDTRLQGRICAVKEMSVAALPLAERPQAIQQFEQEATMLAGLRHPHLPQVYDFFQDGGRHYLVMDFVEGETLAARLATQARPFAEEQVRLWAAQLCDVLAYLHEQDTPIIFRDLKPDNIMLDKDDHIKLIDFGIARLFKSAQTRDTQIIGTPGYAAPEQYGAGQTDARADVYGLGVTLLTLLTGHDPAANPFNLPGVRQLNPAVSASMAAVIQRATQTQAGDRFQSMRDLRQAVQPTSSIRTTRIPRLGCSGASWQVIAWPVLLATGIALFGFTLTFLTRPEAVSPGTVATQVTAVSPIPVIVTATIGPTVKQTAVPPTLPATPAPTPVPATNTAVPPAITATPAPPTAAPTTVPRIVFQSNRDGNFVIYSVNIDGRDLQRLTHSSARDQYPAVSPAGDRIAFQSDRDGNWEIYVMELDGRNPQRLTHHSSSDRLPAWSPDGSSIAFASNRTGAFEIFTMRADGHEVRQVTFNNARAGHPSWSVGNLLSFNTGGDSSRSWRVVTSEVDGRNQQIVTSNGNWSPEWSPDGRTILFVSSRIGVDSDPALFLMDADGGNQRLLYDSPDYEWGARWSGDGQFVLFTRTQNEQDSIYMIAAGGGTPVLIVDRGSYPAWVPGR